MTQRITIPCWADTLRWDMPANKMDYQPLNSLSAEAISETRVRITVGNSSGIVDARALISAVGKAMARGR